METKDLQTQTFRIDGMFCANCQNLIEEKLKNSLGVNNVSVSYKKGKAEITYDPSIITFSKIKALVEELGYKALEANENPSSNKTASQIIGTLVIIFGLYLLLRAFSASGLAAAFPVAQSGMGYGMVLIIGLVTSVHCIAMCGGINLSQTLRGGGKSPPSLQPPLTRRLPLPPSAGHSPATPQSLLFPSILYNSGRLISYTAVGIVVGAIGSVITVSGRFQGAILLLAGIFMLIMGINMLGLFPSLRRFMPQMPKIFTKKINSLSSTPHSLLPTPLIIGFLNGFMPCGPLQAMQLYALSTGSALRGGISMFLFCAGTIPLMFALGAAGGILSGVKGKAFSHHVMQIGAILIAAMGLTMFTNGWNLAGFGNPLDTSSYAMQTSMRSSGGVFTPVIENGVQVVKSTLLPNRYPAIVVQQGIPVRWTINAPQGSINGCNNRFVIREYGIEHTFKYGENIIEFMPSKTGRFSYSCWMGMIRSTITVIAEGESFDNVQEETAKPAGVEIPSQEIILAQVMGNYQTVEINLTDDGFEPAIIVMQNRMPALWNININSDDPGNSQLIFPAHYTVLDMKQGDNKLQLMPSYDFDFSTADNVFYGYVKVVNDINNVNIEAIKTEVANFETLIYPESHFTAATGNGCACCSGRSRR
ncbi:MAG: sulfite exporter TauE/SafE family protein [Treponema sp.]|jgi:sulfite exporter TauE/SafE/plastocyanin domain-containing protein|nr:sulfite exporter TauE/SafE family protein [Treponema sp.]